MVDLNRAITINLSPEIMFFGEANWPLEHAWKQSAHNSGISVEVNLKRRGRVVPGEGCMSGTKTAGSKKTGESTAQSGADISKGALPAGERPAPEPISREEALHNAVLALQSAAGANEQLARALELIH